MNGNMPTHDAIFENFKPFEGKVPINFIVDFVGCRILETIFPEELSQHRTSEYIRTEWPVFDEEYYEWVDLLEAVTVAKDRFVMLELGAGIGRWAIRGALAARIRGIDIDKIRLGLVEPEPLHLDFLKQFLSDNGIPEEIVDVYPGAIGEDPGTVLFVVKKHFQSTADHPREWYGQAKVPADWGHVSVAKNAYFGHDLYISANGQGAIEVPQFAASKLIRNYEHIDLVDLDVQGQEFVALYAAIDALSQRAKRLHIGTHGPEIERDLREMLKANRWECLRDYACGQTSETPKGSIYFQDGIQTWINPRLN